MDASSEAGHWRWPSTCVNDKHIRALMEFPFTFQGSLLQKWSCGEVSFGPLLFSALSIWRWCCHLPGTGCASGCGSGRGGRQVAWSSFCFHPFIRWNNVCLSQKLRWVSSMSIPRNLWKLFRAFKAVVALWTVFPHLLHGEGCLCVVSSIVSLNHSGCFISHGVFICCLFLRCLKCLIYSGGLRQFDFSLNWLRLVVPAVARLGWRGSRWRTWAAWKHFCQSLSDFCPVWSFTVLWARTAYIFLCTRNSSD